MSAPESIRSLVEKFSRNHEAYVSPDYNETQLRREFLDPFFTALGWDVENKQGYAEAYKDVIHEDAIKIGTATKAPDYSFRIGGVRKFFVEAKKPAVNLKDDTSPAYQLRRYAWSAKLPLSILSDFEEFVVYDCRIKPFPDDKPSVGRTIYIPYTEYESRWDEIAEVFSKEAVLKGSFDKYAETNKAKRGTAEVDDAFLREIEDWRKTLAANIALRNPDLSQRELNFAVQRTIDRIIFLRICEDRGIETYGSLMALQNGANTYKRLAEMFHRADEKYNSGLFHFQREKERGEAPDELTPGLSIDDKPLKDIIRNLYYPESPYEFSVLPADILGQVYEQFLGKVIRLTAGHRAVVEDKPEVKKAGGVYYTPTYIVEYIVKNTLGRILGDGGQGIGDSGSHTGGRHAAAIIQGTSGVAKGDGTRGGSLSPVGSPSATRTVRTDKPDAAGGGLDTGEHSGGIRQSTSEGVSSPSLDSERLSGGTGDPSDVGNATELPEPRANQPGKYALTRSGKDAHASHTIPQITPYPNPHTLTPKPTTLNPKQASKLRILDPACGSGSFLIGAYQYLLDWHRDWYVNDGTAKWSTGKNPTLYQVDGGEWRLTTAERKRILLNNIYGVDIDAQAVETTKLSLLLKVLEGENEQTISRQLKMFHERALPDLGNNIKCGNSLIGPDFYSGDLFGEVSDDERMRINAFDWNKEFKKIMVDEDGFDVVIGNPPYIPIESMTTEEKEYFQAHHPQLERKYDSSIVFILEMLKKLKRNGQLSFISSLTWQTGENYVKLRELLFRNGTIERIVNLPFDVFKNAYVDTGVYVLSALSKESYDIYRFPKKAIVRSLDEINYAKVPLTLIQPPEYKVVLEPQAAEILSRVMTSSRFVRLGDISISTQGLAGNMYEPVPKVKNKDHFPYLEEGQVHRYSLEIRRQSSVDMTHKQSLRRFYEAGQKILVRRVISRQDRLLATLSDVKLVTKKDINPFILTSTEMHPNFVLGILNSRLISYLYVNTSSIATKDDFRQTTLAELRRLPIRTINFSDPADKSRHDKMVSLVEQMLDLHKKLAAAKLAHERTALERQIAATDEQIDRLVYELYGLTEEEIKIVEGKQ